MVNENSKCENLLDVVHVLHSSISLSVGGETDKTETPAATGVAVLDDYL